MQLDLSDEETRALVETIEADRYPFSPRIRRSAEMFMLDDASLANIANGQEEEVAV